MSAAVFAQQDTTAGTVKPVADTSVYVMKKSPLGAVLRSAVLPGWGQMYNKSYWKVPVVWGFLGYYGYEWIRQNKKYHENADNYRQSLAGAQLQFPGDFYKINRDFYHDQRDLFAIYMGITYFLNLLDAYVDAHLFDFSVDEEPFTKNSRLNVKFHF